jgi:hypothetical protein
MMDVGGLVAAIALLCAATSGSCSSADPSIPWDVPHMTRELTSELRQFEGLASDFQDVEVLGWRVEETEGKAAPPVQPRRHRVEVALVWGHVGASAVGPDTWALVEAYRHDEDRWRRSLIFRELRAPLPRLRPGETADGTWHGFQRYAKPPTSSETCEFARVHFLKAASAPRRRVSGGLRRNAWLRATGAEPACELDR